MFDFYLFGKSSDTIAGN